MIALNRHDLYVQYGNCHSSRRPCSLSLLLLYSSCSSQLSRLPLVLILAILRSRVRSYPGGEGGGGYSGFQVTRMIEGFFWVRKFGKYFLGVAWFFVRTFGSIKKNRYCPGGCIVLRTKNRLTNVFCFCLIVNYGVALHRTCYTIVCIVPWYLVVYKTSTTSIQSVGFTVTEIPFCYSELLISFACELLRATKSAWDFLGVNFWGSIIVWRFGRWSQFWVPVCGFIHIYLAVYDCGKS